MYVLLLFAHLQPLVSTVEGSFSSAGSGGGIYGTQCGVRLVNSRLVGNTAAANGGGAALQMCQTVFDQSVIENNQVRMLVYVRWVRMRRHPCRAPRLPKQAPLHTVWKQRVRPIQGAAYRVVTSELLWP